MNRLKELFQRKQQDLLSIFYTAGFPQVNDTVAIAKALQASGVDMMEIGIPFSDPVADGPVIQASNKVALDNGMTLALLLKQVKKIRETVTMPIVLMGYFNPVFQYGIEQFVTDAKKAGADGVIIPDLPLAEFEKNYATLFEREDMCFSFLIAPTTNEDRIRKIDSLASGFIYAVSASSTTGATSEFTEVQLAYFDKLKSMQLKNPIMIGFGISNAQTYSKATAYATGAIIGSAFIKALQTEGNIEQRVSEFIKKIRP